MKNESVKAYLNAIVLKFEGGDDEILFNDLVVQAKLNRRTLEQEILYRLETWQKDDGR